MARKSKRIVRKKKIVYQIKVVDSECGKWDRALKYCSNLLDIYNKVPPEMKFVLFDLGKTFFDGVFKSSTFLCKKKNTSEYYKSDEAIDFALEILDDVVLDEIIYVLNNFENNYPREFIDLVLEEKQIRLELNVPPIN